MRLGKRERERLLSRKWGTSEPDNLKPVSVKLLRLGLVDVFDDDGTFYLTETGHLVCALLRELERKAAHCANLDRDLRFIAITVKDYLPDDELPDPC